MGGATSCCMPTNEAEPVSREVNTHFKGPTKNRSCTDSPCLFIFLIALLSLFGLALYCSINGDLNRFLRGYDECGYICGVQNEERSDPKKCIGLENKLDNPFLEIEAPFYKASDLKYINRYCVKNCTENGNYRQFFNRCVQKKIRDKNDTKDNVIENFMQSAAQDLQHTKWQIIYLCLLAFGLSLVIVFLMKFLVGVFVWVVIIGIIATSSVLSIFLWYKWKEESNSLKANENKYKESKAKMDFILALIATIFTIIILLIIMALRKRIRLIIQLFKEAGKVLQNMPLLLTVPIGTFMCLCVTITVCSVFAVLIQSSGFPKVLTYENKDSVYYKKDGLMKFVRIYNVIIFLWTVNFFNQCQHMVISGATATWFFTRNKNNLTSPISTSFGHLFHYHLGSVAFGSFIITFMQIIRGIFLYIQKHLKKTSRNAAGVACMFKSLSCAFDFIHTFLTYFTRNAYIEIAIYGKNFCTSGRLAFQIIVSNLATVGTLSCIGDIVLYSTKLLVVTFTVLVGFVLFKDKPEILYLSVPLSVTGILAYFIAHCFISVYEMVIDTLFICFCEDCNLQSNAGSQEEYYMSKELREFIMSNKRILRVGDESAN